MNESIMTQRFQGKNVVVIGGSKGVGRAIVAAAHAQGAQVLAVARQEEPLKKLADDLSGVHILGLDATGESAPAKVFETLSPDVLIVCAGAIPHTAPLQEQSWEQFSRNWNSDVKMSLLFSQAALTTPASSWGDHHPDFKRCSHRRLTTFRRLRWLKAHTNVPRELCPKRI